MRASSLGSRTKYSFPYASAPGMAADVAGCPAVPGHRPGPGPAKAYPTLTTRRGLPKALREGGGLVESGVEGGAGQMWWQALVELQFLQRLVGDWWSKSLRVALAHTSNGNLEFVLAMQNCEKRRAREDREQFHEVTPTEGLVTAAPDGQQPRLVPQDCVREHELDDFLDLRWPKVGEARHATDPLWPEVAPDAGFLKRQPHELLGEDVEGRWRWGHGFDEALSPQANEAESLEQGFVCGGQEEAVADRVRPSTLYVPAAEGKMPRAPARRSAERGRGPRRRYPARGCWLRR